MLALVEARVQGTGRGHGAAAGAVLRDGWWTLAPNAVPLPELRLTLLDVTPRLRAVLRRPRCQSLARRCSATRLREGDVVERAALR